MIPTANGCGGFDSVFCFLSTGKFTADSDWLSHFYYHWVFGVHFYFAYRHCLSLSRSKIPVFLYITSKIVNKKAFGIIVFQRFRGIVFV